jgi:CopG family nickel-responsive transcriptional regulator
MEKCIRFGISLPQNLLNKFDADNKKRGYTNRSEAIRDLIRSRLVEAEWEKSTEETAGAVVLVYDHHRRGLGEKLMKEQHHHHNTIISTMHAHLDHDNCMEVILLRGKASEVHSFADRLSSTKNVKLGKFVPATLGNKID